MDFLINIVISGLYAVYEYLTAHVLFCLIPAFFIAGAMVALLPKEEIIKNLGSQASKRKAYTFSILAGLLLAVCSCTILPLFAGIKKKGAGVGPAIAFLYTAPATNIMAILLTGSVLGWDFALARIILSVSFAIVIGLIISKIFPEKENNLNPTYNAPVGKTSWKSIFDFIQKKLVLFFATLISILFAGTRLESGIKIPVILVLIFLLLLQLKFRFKKEEIKSWLLETFKFFKVIFPLLLVGIFVAGILGKLIPQGYLGKYLGKNNLLANLIAVLFGVFMYFPTLVEVPMAKTFLDLGMSKGPLLAYLLADPVISLSSILVVRKIMGTKQTLVYILLITVFTTLSGLIYGALLK